MRFRRHRGGFRSQRQTQRSPDAAWARAVLDRLHAEEAFDVVIEGGASGADRLARRWAGTNRVHVETFEADWLKYGRGAGPIRNALMLTIGKPDVVVAFPGGSGTRNMIHQAENLDVEVFEAVKCAS